MILRAAKHKRSNAQTCRSLYSYFTHINTCIFLKREFDEAAEKVAAAAALLLASDGGGGGGGGGALPRAPICVEGGRLKRSRLIVLISSHESLFVRRIVVSASFACLLAAAKKFLFLCPLLLTHALVIASPSRNVPKGDSRPRPNRERARPWFAEIRSFWSQSLASAASQR